LELFSRFAELQPLILEHVLIPFTTSEVDLAALGAAGPRLATSPASTPGASFPTGPPWPSPPGSGSP
jgi:hypothetical protein